MHDLAFVFAGFFVGLVVGLTGVGGGSLMTPILIFFFGVKPYLAVGTDLLFAAFTKMGGTIKLARSRHIDWPVVLKASDYRHWVDATRTLLAGLPADDQRRILHDNAITFYRLKA